MHNQIGRIAQFNGIKMKKLCLLLDHDRIDKESG